MKAVEKKMIQFVENFFEYLKQSDSSFVTSKARYTGSRTSIDLGHSFSLRFVELWGGKKWYLTLYQGHKYRLELFLCRMIFGNDGTILWYLDSPTRQVNTEVFKRVLGNKTDIDKDVVEQIKLQQESIHSETGKERPFNRVNAGYCIADGCTADELFVILEQLIRTIMQNNIAGESRGLYIEEGIAREYGRLIRGRSRIYIEPVKRRDNYTCKACGLKLSVDGQDILHVHHINPLRGVTRTILDDLVCLCPTCHYIAHRKFPPYTPREIQGLLSA